MELTANAHRFVSRLAADRFLGYLQSQKAAMTGEVGAHTCVESSLLLSARLLRPTRPHPRGLS